MSVNIPPTDPIDISEDQIHILLPDKSLRSYKMKPEGLTIGRSPNNDIPLDHPGISRHHARIEFDGQNYRVRDLKSMNGTFLEETRLESENPHIWLPGENLRIGETWLRLERAEQGQTTTAVPAEPSTRPVASVLPRQPPPPTRPVPPPQARQTVVFTVDGSPLDPDQVKFSAGAGWVGVYTNTPNLSVAPGRSAVASLILFNRGPSPDNMRVTVLGVPTDWMPNQSLAVSIPASGQREVNLAFRPPRTTESRAGRHTVAVRVASTLAPDQVVEIRLALTVTAFSQFSSELRPKELWSGTPAQVVITNQGNLPETFTVTLDDRMQELGFEPTQAKITIPPGHSAAVEFRASLRQPRWLGSEMRHSFGAVVTAQSGQNQTHAGEFISNGIIPPWTPIALGVLSIIMCCFIILFYIQLTAPAREARKTDAANNTAIAKIAQATYQAATATAKVINQTATVNAAPTLTFTPTATFTPSRTATNTFTPTPTVLTSTPTSSSTPSIPTADLGISLNNSQSSIIPGTSIAYTIVASNKGPSSITNIQIVDTFPNVLTNIAWTCNASAGSRCQTTNGTGNINVYVDLAVNGSATFTANGTALPGATGLLINAANLVVPPGVTEINNVNNLAVDTDTLTPKVSFSFTKTDNRNTIVPGQATSYSIVATNNGPSATSGVNITDFPPDALTGVTWVCLATGGSSCGTTGTQNGNVNVNVNLNPGGSATVTLNATVKPSASGTLSNTAYLSSPIDPGANNKAATDNTNITSQADLAIGVSVPITATVGSPITYTINITNVGSTNATNIVLTQILPAGTAFISSVPGSPFCTANAGTVTCNLGALAAGSNIQIKIYLQAPAFPGTVVCQLEVNAAEMDPNPANNNAMPSILIK